MHKPLAPPANRPNYTPTPDSPTQVPPSQSSNTHRKYPVQQTSVTQQHDPPPSHPPHTMPTHKTRQTLPPWHSAHTSPENSLPPKTRPSAWHGKRHVPHPFGRYLVIFVRRSRSH